MRRPLEELLSDEDFWPEIQRRATGGRNDVRLVEAAREDGERTLLELQVTTRSPLGALAFHASVAEVDRGWVRVLGAGGPEAGASLTDPVPGGALGPPDLDTGLIVAHDALGGFFVINGGELPGEPGEVLYLSPDTLRWESTELGNTDWLLWLFDADLDKFYDGMRWSGWEDEVRGLTPARAIHSHPPLFTKEGQDIAGAKRRPVPVGELWSLWFDFREQLGIEG